MSEKPDSEPRLIKTHLSFDMLPNSIIGENSAIKVGKLELVSKELNHLAAILHVYAGGLNFMK